MNLLVIGIDKCGSLLAREFAELNRRARNERRIQIVSGAYAIAADQSMLNEVKGRRKDLKTVWINRSFAETGGKVEAVAELLREESGRIFSTINPDDYYNTDAVMLVASPADMLGAAGIPVLAQQLRDRHMGKPIYAMVVLPLESEEANPVLVHNTAVCLNSTYKIANAVFPIAGEKYAYERGAPIGKDEGVAVGNIVVPFYDLLSASAEVDPKYAGAKAIGIGDTLQTLSGWTAFGVGGTDFSTSRFFRKMETFSEKGSETTKIMEAMNTALANLSIDISLEDSGKALYLLSIPAQGANVDMVKVLGKHLRELTNNAEIRGGDFYWVRGIAQVTLVFSNLKYIEKVKGYYDRAVGTRSTDAEPLPGRKAAAAGSKRTTAAAKSRSTAKAAPPPSRASATGKARSAGKTEGKPEKKASASTEKPPTAAKKRGRPKKKPDDTV